MPTLHTYQLLDRELPAILMIVLMTVAFVVVLTVTILKSCCFTKGKEKIPPVFMELVALYFPSIKPQDEDEEIEFYGQKMSSRSFGLMAILLIPVMFGTMFITFWNVFLVEESVRGDCKDDFDCFPKIGSDFLQQEPVNNCSVLYGDATFECYRLVFRYAEGLGAAGGILFFTAVFSRLYFSLLVTIYKSMEDDKFLYCRFFLYVVVWSAAADVFLLFVANSVSVQEIRDEVFQSIVYQIQFAMYALSLLVIVVSGVVLALGIETKNGLR